MGKPALGKGMKDLLAKRFESEKEEPSEKNALEELEVNIERYQAQGYDISALADLRGKEADDVQEGIEAYRNAIKMLTGALTVLRSLQGYGYSKEIEKISKDIKNPRKAKQVLREVEDLKERALSEHGLTGTKKDSPKLRISESLRAQSEKLNLPREGEEVPTEEMDTDMDIDPSQLDELLDDLNDIGDAFSLPIQDEGEEETEEGDPFLEKIEKWQEMGYFVDRLKKILQDEEDRAEEEFERFERDVERMEALKKRFYELEVKGSEDFMKEIELKFQYPHMAKEVENELSNLESSVSEGDREETENEEESQAPSEEEPQSTEGEVEEQPSEEGETEEHPDVPDAEEHPEVPDAEEHVETSAPEAEEQKEVPSSEPPSEIEAVSGPAAEIKDEKEIEGEGPEKIVGKEPEEEGLEKIVGKEPEEEGADEEISGGEDTKKEDEIPPEYADKEPGELLDMAKEAYRDGKFEESLLLFDTLLKKDPDNSKARFMIRRLKSKLGQ